MNFSVAILREVPDSFARCISAHPLHSTLHLERAREQHRGYRQLLEDLGLETIVLPKANHYPDSCFVEDTAVVHGSRALITRLARPSRQGEEKAIAEMLQEFKELVFLRAPATLEGGDVIHLSEKLLSGWTSRTTLDGIKQASQALNVPVEYIRALDIVHLKSYVTFIGQNTVVATPRFARHPFFSSFTVIEVNKEESYAANTLNINEVVIVPKGYPQLRSSLKEHGFEVFTLPMSEFEKCEGALTCLSIRF